MVNGTWTPAIGGFMANRFPGWRDRKGAAVTGENYVEGGKSRGMTTTEVDEVKKKRGRRGQTAIESETLGGGR